MKPLFPQQESPKNPIFGFFRVMFNNGKASFSSQNYFSQAEISYESKGLLFDQLKVSEKAHRVKNTEKGNFYNQ